MAAGTAVWRGPAVPGASLPRPAVPELPCPGPAWQRIDGKDSQGLQGRGRAKARGFGGGGEAVSHGRAVCILPPARRRRAEAVRHESRPGRRAWRRKKICRQKAMPFQWLECLSLAMSPMRVQALQNMWLPLFLCLSKLDTRQLHGYLSRAGLPALRHKQGCCSSRRRRIFPACFCTRSLVSEQILPGRTAVLKLCLQRSQTLHSNGS